ncbi:MAG: U32 family peptidase [Actinobacteria bacterium]|nr:U32 family peptidase [Actinomycetota bacterium]
MINGIRPSNGGQPGTALDRRLVVPSNWDPDLLGAVATAKPAYMYGSLPAERGMRTMLQLPTVGEEEIAEYVTEAARQGIKFLYVMNSTCNANREMSEDGRWEFLQRCQWILDSGFAGVTLANPMLMEIVARDFPELELHVSLLTGVKDPRAARFYEEIGASLIHLDPEVARDFATLKMIRESVDLRLSLVVNEGCVLQCPLRGYHSNVISHSRESIEGQYHVDYCYYNCAGQKVSDPAELLRMPWIRPEDIHVYLAEGIDHFKIAGREKMGGGPSSHSEWIAKVTAAYHNERCDDVAELLVGLEGIQSLTGELGPEPPDLHIDSRRLDGFIRYFEKGLCDLDCSRCDYCDAWARKAVSVDGDARSYLKQVESSLDRIRTGSYWTRSLEV